MQIPRFQSRIIIASMLALFLIAVGGFWWLCTQSDGIAFLPKKSGAEWIVYPQPPDAVFHHAVPIRVVFRHTFILDTPPARAALTVCAFRSASVAINGQTVTHLDLAGQHWKSPSTADVTGLLRSGTNRISVSVTNNLGPPALWLRLQTDEKSEGTDKHWRAAFADGAWQTARRASQPPSLRPDDVLYGSERTINSVKRVWPVLAIFCVVSTVLVLGINRLLKRRTKRATVPAADSSVKLIYGLFIVVAIARIVLSINNLWQLPRPVGFDAEDHERYIQFILANHALPWPENGWEMYQPPLYYAGNALLLEVSGLRVPGATATFVLRSANVVIGLIYCWLALLCFRLLFPDHLSAQAVGLLVAAFLPPHVYLSQYVTNEPLTGLFVTVAFYLCLRAFRAEKSSVWLDIGIGAALGAAMLTKFSALLAIPVLLAALGLRPWLRREPVRSDCFRSLGMVLLSCLVVCGWYYVRIWAHTGRPLVGNWGTDSVFRWWQQPGFQTSAYYLRFGQALISPLFSGFYSFGDGIYSTLWGDGLVGGTANLLVRPPWNYNLMNVGYLLAIAISCLFLVGCAMALVRFIRQPAPEWLIVLGLPLVFFLGIIYMSLAAPYSSVFKAFYAFPALVPFSALVAVGWNWLGQRHRAVRTALWVILLVWVMTVFTAFWIRGSNPETWRLRGVCQLNQKNYREAAESLSRALGLKPDDAAAHYFLAGAVLCLNRESEAVQQYQEALRLNPDFALAHNNLAVVLAAQGHLAAAIQHSQEAVRLQPNNPRFRYCFGDVLTNTSRLTEAIAQFQTALQLQPDYAEARDSLGSVYLERGLILFQKGQLSQAIAPLQEGLKIHPDDFEAWKCLGLIFSRQEKPHPAVVNFQQALELQPENLEVCEHLAWIFATSRDAGIRNGAEAVRLAKHACKMTHYRQTEPVTILAAAYAEAGRFDDAMAMAQKACDLASASGEQAMLKLNRELMLLYRAHQGYTGAASGP